MKPVNKSRLRTFRLCRILCCAGMKLANLSKILKCAANDDAITMKSEDGGDTLTFMFESAG